jgi:hypothetical protein
MRRWLYPLGLFCALVVAGAFVTAAISRSRAADKRRAQQQQLQQPKETASAKDQFSVKVEPWGPSQEEIDEAISGVTKDAAVRKLLDGTENRLISFDRIDPDNKSGNELPPNRYRATLYDYTNERSVIVLGSFQKPGAYDVSTSSYQPLPNPEEFEAALAILADDAQLGFAVRDKKVSAYEPMPPLYFAPAGKGRAERVINVGLKATAANDPSLARDDEVVAVHMSSRTVQRFKSGAPPTSSAAPAADCSPPPSGGSSTGRGLAGQFQFTINAQDGTLLWNFLAIRPSASSGENGSAIELVDVKYKGKSVLKRANVPILNILYDGNTCGPYRDWQYAENQFTADPTGGTNVASGVRSCTVPALTVMETNNDSGNHQGIAYYTEGDAVVLVSEMSAGWYRYISEWRFHADGTIQPRFGMGAVANSCTCNGHVHHVYWRFDFDIDSPSPNRILDTHGHDFNAFSIPFEAKRYRNTKLAHETWIVDNSKTGDAYKIVSGSNDGYATGDAYARGDLWFLAYSASEMDDANVHTNTQANIDAFVGVQKLNNADVVVWYAGHINHNRGMFNIHHPHSISGALVTGPDLIPLRW